MLVALTGRPAISAVGRGIAGFLAAGLLAVLAHAGAAASISADSLHAKYAELRNQLGENPYRKPLYLDSGESQGSVTGDIYALVEHPFATVAAALNSPREWCEILILSINTKYCRASMSAHGSVLHLSIGTKYEQPLDQAYRLEFEYRVSAQTSTYLQVRLGADQGPLSTRDYRIVLEAVPVADGRTFLHLSYSYAFDTVGRLAMQVYLATGGRGKVGFTVIGTQADGQSLHIGGVRGVVERNTMRYFLAIEAFLGALAVPPQVRLEKRLRDWFTAAERYPRQLHEIERGEYLDMKRREYLRQQAGPAQKSEVFRESLYPVRVNMEKYAGPKTTRVIAILEDEDGWKRR